MPQATWTPLANITLGSSASSVTFSNIPNTYRDLIIVANGAGATGGSCHIRVNSDTGANYPTVTMRGTDVGTISSATYTTGYWFAGGLSNSRFDAIIQIQDYPVTDKHKTMLARAGVGASQVQASAIRWSNTNAITSVTITIDSGNYASNSTFALYGVIA